MMLSNSGTSEDLKLKASRNANRKTHARYQRLMSESIEKNMKR